MGDGQDATSSDAGALESSNAQQGSAVDDAGATTEAASNYAASQIARGAQNPNVLGIAADSLWVRLDLTPSQAANEPGSLRLRNGTGTFDRTLAIAHNYLANDSTVDVHFENVPATASYSLSYIADDSHETPILQDVAFESLQDGSLTGEDVAAQPQQDAAPPQDDSAPAQHNSPSDSPPEEQA